MGLPRNMERGQLYEAAIKSWKSPSYQHANYQLLDQPQHRQPCLDFEGAVANNYSDRKL